MLCRAAPCLHALADAVQVSILLQEGMQDGDGQFYLRAPATCGDRQVGTVSSVLPDGSHAGSKQVQLAFSSEIPNEWFCHPCELGANLYECARTPASARLAR